MYFLLYFVAVGVYYFWVREARATSSGSATIGRGGAPLSNFDALWPPEKVRDFFTASNALLRVTGGMVRVVAIGFGWGRGGEAQISQVRARTN